MVLVAHKILTATPPPAVDSLDFQPSRIAPALKVRFQKANSRLRKRRIHHLKTAVGNHRKLALTGLEQSRRIIIDQEDGNPGCCSRFHGSGHLAQVSLSR